MIQYLNCAGSFYVNLTEARVIGEEGAANEKMPPEDRAVQRPV